MRYLLEEVNAGELRIGDRVLHEGRAAKVIDVAEVTLDPSGQFGEPYKRIHVHVEAAPDGVPFWSLLLKPGESLLRLAPESGPDPAPVSA